MPGQIRHHNQPVIILIAVFTLMLTGGLGHAQLSDTPSETWETVVSDWIYSVVPQARSGRLPPQPIFIALTRDLADSYAVGLTPGADTYESVINLLQTRVGACGSLSNALLRAADLLGYQARYVNLYNVPDLGLGHTLAEIYYQGDWHLFDPTYGVVYQRNRRLLSFEALQITPEDVDHAKMAISNRAYNLDAAGEFYTSSTAYEWARPAGPVAADIPMTFAIEIDLSPLLAQAPRGTPIWSIGGVDGSSADLSLLNTTPPIPAGLSFIGSSYMNRFHRYVMTGLQPSQVYTLRLDIAAHTQWFEAVSDGVGLVVLRGQTIQTTAASLETPWLITFRALSENAILQLTHEYVTSPNYLLFDRLVLYVDEAP